MRAGGNSIPLKGGDFTVDAQLYYEGQWLDGVEMQRFTVENPATNQVIGTAVSASLKDLDRIIGSAEKGSSIWGKTLANERARALKRVASLIRDHQDELALLLTQEEGKAIGEARSEIGTGADFFDFYAAEALRTYGTTMPSPSPSRSIWTTRSPIGVSALITPWNYPFSTICRKMAPALAAGCSVIVKPAEETPLIASKLIEIIHAVNLPKGVVNFVTGDPQLIGTNLVADPRVRKVSFTGSTEIGRTILHNAADNITSVSLELGGNAPVIIFDDASIDDAVQGIIRCKFRNAGQVCLATNRIYVQRNVLSQLRERLHQAVNALQVGDGTRQNVQMGPLINQQAIDKVSHHVADATAKGATIECGGEAIPGAGYFYTPTILSNASETMTLAHEETFGPVAPLFTFDTEDEVYERANGTPYGLVAYVFTKNLARAMRAIGALDFGVVGVNDPGPSLVEAPLGGVKASGLGREGGHEGIEEFLETKYVSMRY